MRINNQIVDMYSLLKTAQFIGVTKRTVLQWLQHDYIPYPNYKTKNGVLLYTKEQALMIRKQHRRAKKEGKSLRDQDYVDILRNEFMKMRSKNEQL